MKNNAATLLRHLPAIYQTPQMEELHAILAIFEAVLLSGDGQEREELAPTDGLAQKIGKIPALFDPARAPSEFLPWLSQWVVLSRIQGLSEKRLRRLIAESVSLYSWRGTKHYMHRMLQYFLPDGVHVGEDDIIDQGLAGYTLGISRLGLDSWIGRDKPFCFLIRIGLVRPMRDPEEMKRIQRLTEEVIRPVVDLAKPAHTSYALQWPPAEGAEQAGKSSQVPV